MKINLIRSISNNAPNIAEHDNIAIDQINEIGNNVCHSLILHNVLQYIPLEQLEIVLSKIRHGGVITIHCVDMLEVAKALYWGTINIDKLPSLISECISYHSAIETKSFLEQRGYIIEEANVNVDSLSFIIKAKRP
jgi:hypothetical protein